MTPRHPCIPLLSAEDLRLLGQQQADQYLLTRARLIENENRDPFRYVWIPPMWEIVIACLDIPIDRVPAPRRAAIRARLGIDKPKRFAAFLGGGRSGKSYLAAWLVNQILKIYGVNVAAFQKNENTSIETQHPACYKMLPIELRPTDGSKIKTPTDNISYSISTGFGPGHYVFNGGKCVFRFFTQEEDAAEGTAYKIVWLDEKCPPKVRENMKARTGNVRGWVVNTYTPIDGYTPLIRGLTEHAKTLVSVPAFLLPTDNGAPDFTRALGFANEADRAAAEILGPNSRPYNLDAWLAGGDLHVPVPSGRTFETVPLIQVHPEESLVIVYNHTNNNPYGDPASIIETIQPNPEQIRRRWYGYALSNVFSAFPLFSRSVHVIDDDKIPKVGQNIHVVDPGPGLRNYFMIWARVVPGAAYIYREWPGYQLVPGRGIPGAWAVPSEREDRYDGDPGPAQVGFGWGTIGYKREIARLEGWTDYTEKLDLIPGQTESQNKTVRDRITAWDHKNGTREPIMVRLLDARFGNSKLTTANGVVDYYSTYADIGLYFDETAGKRADGKTETETGLGRLSDLLEYDPNLPIDIYNRPRLFIARSCLNCINALETYTGADGQAGAWKDVIDVIRYFAQADVQYVDPKNLAPVSPCIL